MKINKKIVKYALIILMLMAATTGIIIALSRSNSTGSSKTSTVSSLVSQAQKAKSNNDTDKAKSLLQQAKTANDSLPKSDSTVATKIDIEAQLYLLEHQGVGK